MLPRSLYIHVPFCSRRCSYCDFAVQAVSHAPTEEWLDAVMTELKLTAADQRWNQRLVLDTLYIGGGTPSLLDPGAMHSLIARISPWAVLAPGAEWTCEANPESFTPAVASAWRAAGVNRLSLGAQTFSQEALRWMGRLHGVDGPVRAMGTARVAGFKNVSIDLIFGLPARLDRDWRRDLEKAIALDPEHVSLYGLTAEASAPLGRWVGEGRETLADEDRYADEYLLANDLLTAAGFGHYEVSNFARPGLRSRHNSVYWTGAPYAALGPGAHAFYPPQRRWNVRSWESYRDLLQDERLPIDGKEEVEREVEELERIWLGLRIDAGLDLSGASPKQHLLADLWRRNGLAVEREDVLQLNVNGWLLLDRLAMQMQEAGGEELRWAGAIDDRSEGAQISANSNGFEA